MQIIPIACALDNFAYLLVCNDSGAAAVVDPTEAYPVWREAERAGVKLVAVFCTHHHTDHVAGLEDLLDEQPDILVYGFRGDERRIPGLNQPLEDGAEVRVGELRGRVVHTPGHTAGSLCYHMCNALFTGDTLFGAGCGRLFEGSPAEMYRSLNRRIALLPEGTELYFGHDYTRQNLLFARMLEPENQLIIRRLLDIDEEGNTGLSVVSTLALEKMTNPFLRCAEQSIRRNFITVGFTPSDEEIFALLRQRRDRF